MYKHLSKEERYSIEKLVQAGKSNNEIGRILERSVSTISREIRRNDGNWKYRGEVAQEKADLRQQLVHRQRISEKVWEKVYERFNQDHSPEQIAGALRLRGICISHETIYQRLYREIEANKFDYSHLRSFRKKRRRRLKGLAYRSRSKVSIEQRPSYVEPRQEFGHWEGDTVELGRGGAHLVTLVERKTRFLLTAVVPNKRSDVVQQAIEQQLLKFPQAVRSLTLDNGSEFAKHSEMAANLSADIYFTHPHSPWERGTNENTNGLLRQYFPKNQVFSSVDLSLLAICRQNINTRPRKSLGFLSPAQSFFSAIALLY